MSLPARQFASLRLARLKLPDIILAAGSAYCAKSLLS
jgi:hypothetical protein